MREERERERKEGRSQMKRKGKRNQCVYPFVHFTILRQYDVLRKCKGLYGHENLHLHANKHLRDCFYYYVVFVTREFVPLLLLWHMWRENSYMYLLKFITLLRI